MAHSPPIIPELEAVLRNASAGWRARTARRITDLFIRGARRYGEEHVALFDAVLGRLAEEIEAQALIELASRLSVVDNAPIGLVQRLARQDDVSIAGPLLKRSVRLAEPDLTEISRSKGQDHLLAISQRLTISEAVTDILVARGDHRVARQIAVNHGAKLSERGLERLIERAESDDILATRVGQRPDIPAHVFRDLVMRASELVQRRLLASASPQTRAEISRVILSAAGEVGAERVYDFGPAQHAVLALQQAGKLDEQTLCRLAAAGKFEECAAALSLICAVPLNVIARLLSGERADPVLILCRAVGFRWPTARAVLEVCAIQSKSPSLALADAKANFELLSPAAAQRVVLFWRLGQGGSGAPD
jgi:uncharacterized protein (DUF2336 family)